MLESPSIIPTLTVIPRRIVQRKEPLDLMRQFQDRTGSLLGAHARMGRLALDHDRETADRLARCSEFARRSEGGFEHECSVMQRASRRMT